MTQREALSLELGGWTCVHLAEQTLQTIKLACVHPRIQTVQHRHTPPQASILSHTASPHMGWGGMWGWRQRGLPSRCCWKSNTSPPPLPLSLPIPLLLNIY